MSLKLNIPSLDQDASTEGVWCDYQKGIRFRIARFGNKGYTDAMKHVYRVNKRAIESKSMSDDVADELMVDALAKHILVDWEGLKDGAKDFPYSVDNAKQLLLAPEYLELRTWVVEQSKEAELFRAGEQKK